MGIFHDSSTIPTSLRDGAGVAKVWDLSEHAGKLIDPRGKPEVYRVLWKGGPIVKKWPPGREFMHKVLTTIDDCPQHTFIIECDNPIGIRWWGQWAAYYMGEAWPPANVLYRFVDLFEALDPLDRPDLYDQSGYNFELPSSQRDAR